MNAKLTLATLGVLTLGIVLFWLVKKYSRKSDFGFRDVVRNPRHWEKMVVGYAQLKSEQLPNWSAKEIEEQVKQYVFTEADEENLRPLEYALEALSPQTHEALLAILRDPSNQEALSELRNKTAPVMRICKLFTVRMPEEAVNLLKPFLQHESDEIRKECILAISESGHGIALPSVVSALKDEDIQWYALLGLKRALEANVLSDEISAAILPELEASILANREVENCSELLSLLDFERAKNFLSSESVLSPHAESIHEVISTIREFQFQVPREHVLELYVEISKREMKYPDNYAVGELLALLGSARNPLDETLLEENSRHTDRKVAEGAVKGLLTYHGLDDFEKKIWNDAASDAKPLSKEQRMYLAVHQLDAEVNNGGHSQYFFNSYSDNWQNALDGLKEMGLEDRAAIFQESLNYFGTKGPSIDRNTRQMQLSKIHRKHEADLNNLDSRYYASKENVVVSSIWFVIKNAPKFQ